MKQPQAFSPYKFPDAKNFQISFFLFVAGVSLFFSPVFIPDLQSGSLYNGAVSSVRNFELQDELNAGAFKETDRSGDTRPSWEATFRGVSVLGKPEHVEGAKAFVLQAQQKGFNKNAKEIYEGITLLKKLGLLGDDQVTLNKYYDSILALSESNSAFRLNSGRSASVAATFYAFEAIEELGKFKEFQATPQYTSAVNFVAAQKEFGGYHDVPNKNATILTTFHAIQVLAKTQPTDEQNEKFFGNLTNYVLRVQSPDGGFFNSLLEAKDATKVPSTATTAQAIYIVEFLKEKGFVHSFHHRFLKQQIQGVFRLPPWMSHLLWCFERCFGSRQRFGSHLLFPLPRQCLPPH
eukprot:TRINITY_DN2786_c0_g1_i1.p1 TRINITY_DN2786_c0_g1~~TRINITY_DN2786_c0_g1_i1.p1  ORF type:complete len:349 (+),score=125.23 TRINITY_DN2786_c0_g1_i1:101-1147(+)